jgi:hypothetical protein
VPPVSVLTRGTVFHAEHDTTFGDWHNPSAQWKICLAFNATPATAGDEVHYFFFTSNVSVYRENPVLFADFLEFPKGCYDFIKVDSALDFRKLRRAPFVKLRGHGLRVAGSLSVEDLRRCEYAAGIARVLPMRDKKLLGLR